MSALLQSDSNAKKALEYYKKKILMAVKAVQDILTGIRKIRVNHPGQVDNVRGLHRALDYYCDRWTKDGITPPCPVSGDILHHLKVALKAWMESKKINTLAPPEMVAA